MANSFTKVTLGAAQTVGFTTPTYIVSSHLTVSVNNVTVPAVQAGATQKVFGSFTSTNPLYYILVEGSTSLSFSEALPVGAVVLVNRNSSQSTKLVSYSDSGLLTSDVLNEDSNQAFFIAQEALDQSAGNFDSSFEASQGVTVAKVAGIEALADVTDTANVVAALTAGTNVAIASNGTISSTDTNTTYTVQDGQLSQNNFTDADHTKLNAIEASADVTDTANVVAALTAGTNVAIASNGTISSTDTNTTYTGGTGLTLSGTTFNVDAAQTGITSVGVLTGLTSAGNVLITAIADGQPQATPTPILELFQSDGPQADDGDHLGEIQFTANNDNGYSPAKHKYAGIHAEIIDETNATEDGSLHFTAITAGTEDTTVLTLNGTESTFSSPVKVAVGPVTIFSSTTNADLVITNNENSSADASPIIELFRSQSNGADGEGLGKLEFYGGNDRSLSSGGAEKTLYGSISVEIADASDGSEDGALKYSKIVGGAQQTGDLVTLPLNGGVQFPAQSAAPSAPANGQAYYDTDDHKLKLYANGAWVDLN